MENYKYQDFYDLLGILFFCIPALVFLLSRKWGLIWKNKKVVFLNLFIALLFTLIFVPLAHFMEAWHYPTKTWASQVSLLKTPLFEWLFIFLVSITISSAVLVFVEKESKKSDK